MADKKKSPGRPKGSKNKTKTNVKNKKENSSKKRESNSSSIEDRVKDEVAAIILIVLGIFLIISIQTNIAGAMGNIVGNSLKGVFGLGAFIIPYLFIVYGILVFLRLTVKFGGRTIVLITLFFLSLDLAVTAHFVPDMKYGILGMREVFKESVALKSGGVFSMYAGQGLYQLIGLVGLYLFSISLSIICLLLLVNTPISNFVSNVKNRKTAREERKQNAKLKKIEEETAKLMEEEELEEKRQAVEKAGRQLSMDYKPPSEIAEELSKVRTSSEKRKVMPKLNSREWKRLSESQRNILTMMQSDNNFGESPIEEGFGLDGTQPNNISQQEKTNDGNIENEPVKFNGYEDNIETEENQSFDGFIKDSKILGNNKKSEIEPKNPKESVVGVGIGGNSIATAKSETEKSNSEVSVTPQKKGRYKLPPLELLNQGKKQVQDSSIYEDLGERAKLLEATLNSFNVMAKVVNVIAGPSVTRYEIEPARGVKVSSITKLSDDLALNMRAKSIRIEAPIPGKAAVGIEIENEHRQMVTVKEILESKEFRNHKSKLAFSVGRDIGGNPVVADLGKMPHMLIAGATGSGKSVCINTIITSILYKARPEEVKLVLIDPKMVELGNYNGIPHLLIPVVTDASKAAVALQWAVAEMTDRYKKFAKEGVRDIGAYNTLMKEEGSKEEILPQIVVIIDELADLMMVASSQVEDAICRLAQLARAAGMHLILATQRPSVDVITGLIKANVPSRIAFMVSSQIDSRTVIDMAGAEKLVGNGDMLFKPQDLNKPKRIQGPFISDDEVKKVIDFVKNQVEEPEYNETVIEHIEKGNSSSGEIFEDELLDDAIDVVVSAGQASVSMLQRRFRIGYNRAARIVDMMEDQGIVGPQEGSKPRQVMITEIDLERLREEKK